MHDFSPFSVKMYTYVVARDDEYQNLYIYTNLGVARGQPSLA